MQAKRALIAGFLSFAVAVAARAEEPKHLPQVGFLAPPAPDKRAEEIFKGALMEGLRRFGYVEGESIHVEPRAARTMEDLAENGT